MLTREQAEDERVLLALEQQEAASPRPAGFPRLVGLSDRDCLVIKLLTMQRVEYQADGPLTQLARDVLGLADVSGLAQRADEEKADYPSIRMRPEYIKSQDVATTQDVQEARALT